LCNRIAIIDNGEIHALDTPQGLKKLLKNKILYSIELERESYFKLKELPYTTKFTVNPVKDGKTEIKFQIEDEGRIIDILNYLKERGFNLTSFRKREPTLEDVFIEIVGKKLEENEERVSD
jgi:ABC-2 type transport system ATP-binding protein